jgi:hypothetical protein
MNSTLLRSLMSTEVHELYLDGLISLGQKGKQQTYHVALYIYTLNISLLLQNRLTLSRVIALLQPNDFISSKIEKR